MKKQTFAALKKSMGEGVRIAKGEKLAHARVAEYIVREPKKFGANQIKKLRQEMGLSQPVFAVILGVSVQSIRGWEQGRSIPSMMARRFLEVIEDDPQAFLDQAESMEIFEAQRA